MPQVEVIRIIKYVGDEAEVRAAIARSLAEGVRYCKGYEIHVATHSSNLPPAVELSANQVSKALNQTERKTAGTTSHINDLYTGYQGDKLHAD